MHAMRGIGVHTMWSFNGGAAENQQEPATKFPEKCKICSKLTLPKTSWKPAVAGEWGVTSITDHMVYLHFLSFLNSSE